MAGTGTLTVTPDTGSGTVTINTLPPSGQATGANSLPVVLASDQTLPLPTGAAKETGGNLATLVANSPTLGQKSSAGSIPVVLSSDGPFATSFGLTTDAPATSDAGSFGLIALTKRLLGKIPGLGQALGAASLPVVLASDQSALKTTQQSNAPRVKTTAALAAVNAVVTLACDGMATGTAQITGTWVGVISWLASIDDGTTYFPVNAIPLGAAGGTAASTASANGAFEFATSGYTHIQAQMTAYTSGSATVLLGAASQTKVVRPRVPANDSLWVSDAQNAPFQGATAITLGTAFTVGRGVQINCSTTGDLVFTYADGSTATKTQQVGTTEWSGAFTKVASPASNAAVVAAAYVLK